MPGTIDRAGAVLRGAADGEERREAARLMGRVSSEAKAAAARENGLLSRSEGRPPAPLTDYECTCGGGDTMTPEAHKTTCPRGRAIRRRAKAGKL